MFRKGRVVREWRNRQTRTFEGRVFTTYGFKSRLSHQEEDSDFGILFYSFGKCGYGGIGRRVRFRF